MMNRYLIIFLFSFLYSTFSIVAVDTNTNQVGSAGGSCIANSIIISDIHPGIGVIHTQSYWNQSNQDYASLLMTQGYSPYDIMLLLEQNDVQNNPDIRQYGAVDLYQENNYGMLYEYECDELDGTVWYGDDTNSLGQCSDTITSRSASFTGDNCLNWKGQVNGINYAIQGNILLNEDILSGIEEAFINTNGPLDQKLMAALQGGKVPGADSRCLDEGISTLSAFIRVAKPDDQNNFYMDLNVNSVIPHYNNTGNWIDPIDTLQVLYNDWYIEDFEFIVGDINQDYIVNILDIVLIVNFIMTDYATGLDFYLSDMNTDNIINIQDVILLINIILTI